MSTVALVIIAGGKRVQLIDEQILPRALSQDFNEIVVVGEHHGEHHNIPARYLHVPAIAHSTIDALVKRDVGTLATTSEWLFYLSDDHTLFEDALSELKKALQGEVLAPSRWGMHPEKGLISLNMGVQDGYVAGHAGIYHRSLIQRCPWSTLPHHRNWDLLGSAEHHQYYGARMGYAPQVRIMDIEPGGTPWI